MTPLIISEGLSENLGDSAGFPVGFGANHDENIALFGL
jgi:hypothetical protein